MNIKKPPVIIPSGGILDDRTVDSTLRSVIKGAGLFSVGTVIGILLAFLGRVVLTRTLDVDDYGYFSISVAFFTFFSTIGFLGLSSGLPRLIGYYRGKKDYTSIHNLVRYGFQIGAVSGIVTFITILLTADLIAEHLFHEPDVALYLRIVAAAIPCTVVLRVGTSIYRGFDDPLPKVLFIDIVMKGARFTIFLVMALMGITLMMAVFGFFLSVFVTMCASLVYFALKSPIKGRQPVVTDKRRELLLFSLPLLTHVFMFEILTHFDVIMLGYFREPDEVGIYDASRMLATNLKFIMFAIAYIYVPMGSKLFAEQKLVDLRRVHAVLTKWAFLIAFPAFFLLFSYSEVLIDLFFGDAYTSGYTILMVLSVGYLAHIFFGPNINSMVVIGRNKMLMNISLTVTALNVGVNLALIPVLGGMGAAIATFTSFATMHTLIFIILFRGHRFNPFNWNYLKTILSAVGLVCIIYGTSGLLGIHDTFWVIPYFMAIYGAVFPVLFIKFRAYEQEDINLLKVFQRKTGISLSFLLKRLK